MELKITTLIENMPDNNEELLYEHGFSLFIEFDKKKILFDTGQSSKYIDNAKALSIPLEEIDDFIVSHGHYDHSGGVMNTLELLKKPVKMYVGEGFFRPKYKHLSDGTYRFNGIAFTEEDLNHNKIKLRKLSGDTTFLSGNIVLFKNFTRTNDFEKLNQKFMVKQEEEMELDDFSDEIVLGLITRKGLVIVAGCSHVGIVNILTTITSRINIPIYAVLGGTHLIEADAERIDKTIEAFKAMNIERIAVSHCTGDTGIEMLKQAFGDKFVINNTGNVFIV